MKIVLCQNRDLLCIHGFQKFGEEISPMKDAAVALVVDIENLKII